MNPTSIRGIAALVGILSTSAAFAGVAPPPSSTLEISRGTNAGSTSVKVLDSYDQVWILQSSSDLKTWTDVETLKIHNGNFARGFVADPTRPKLFFRTVYDPAQKIASTVESALHLPGTSFNYAAPVLPASLS